MREVDSRRPDSSLRCFNVPALAPRLNLIETALLLSAVCRIHKVSSAKINTWCLGITFIYILYSIGDRTEPGDTPPYISLGEDIPPSTLGKIGANKFH
jgi:hypothetical protein